MKISPLPTILRFLILGVFAIAGSVILTSCGSTSPLQSTRGAPLTSSGKFSKVVVQDFKSTVSNEPERGSPAKIYFADHIALALKKRGRFSSVVRNAKPDANTLVIGGTITNYNEGSVTKRLLLGMGFGMAEFKADVEFRDGKGLTIGAIKVDKNSWPLGGGLGASQTPQGFMDGAAQKVAEEAGKLAR
jgi:Domain of unknown function (DUF4410)